jgi:hypothetical protein
MMARVLRDACHGLEPAVVDVEANEPGFKVRAGQETNGEFLVCSGGDLHLMEQPTAVAESRSVVEQPFDPVRPCVEDRPPIAGECRIHLSDEPAERSSGVGGGGRASISDQIRLLQGSPDGTAESRSEYPAIDMIAQIRIAIP